MTLDFIVTLFYFYNLKTDRLKRLKVDQNKRISEKVFAVSYRIKYANEDTYKKSLILV